MAGGARSASDRNGVVAGKIAQLPAQAPRGELGQAGEQLFDPWCRLSSFPLVPAEAGTQTLPNSTDYIPVTGFPLSRE